MEIFHKLQNFLFEYPLYTWCRPGDAVLIRGDDEFAACFADQCLQASQGMDLRIFWQIREKETREHYLSARPALKNFIILNGKACPGDSCADLTILLPGQWAQAESCSYCFASDPEIPENGGFLAQVRGGNIIANREPQQTAAPDELMRMAFNTHLVWEGEGNIDFEGAYQRFRQPANQNGSLAFALSIPYKLQAVGIDCRDPYEAARRLQAILTSDASEDWAAADTLALLEHRRWIMEMVCRGVTAFRDGNGQADYEICVKTCSVKQKTRDCFRHPCLQKSRPGIGLKAEAYEDHENWDHPCREDRNLDDLDTMSLRLHRTMLKASEKLREHPESLSIALEELKEIYREPLQKRALDRYRFCIQNILDYSRPYASQFESYERAMKAALPELSGYERQKAERLLADFRKKLFPALNLYRDYKQYDRDLIRKLPYILTAKYPVHLCLALGTTASRDNSDQFKSVASATALYARKLTYLYAPDPSEKAEHLRSRLKAIRRYFHYRGSHCTIDLKILVDSAWGEKRKKLEQTLREAEREKYIDSWCMIFYTDGEDLIEKALDAVRDSGADYYDGSNVLMTSPSENGRFTQNIPIPYLEFDSYHRKFGHLKDCKSLAYTPVTSFLQVEDMFALMNAEDLKFNYQDYADTYRDYWEIYCGDAIGEKNFPLCARSWTRVSNLLKTGGSSCFSLKEEEVFSRDPEEILVVKKMLNALQQKKMIRNLHTRPGNRAGSIKVSLDICGEKVKSIFSKAGEILEIYVYFEACAIGWFDDVQSGYQFRWEFGEVSNEMDCVLTHGYRSLLVECKSTRDGSEDFYLTLDSLADHFGIGYKKVLIMVTDTTTEQYRNFKSRGEQMDIITISGRQELDRIGQRLREIMEY